MRHRQYHPVRLLDLIECGMLRIGRLLYHGTEIAVVEPGGLRVDGHLYDSPSPAARAVNGNSDINGWEFWRLDPWTLLCDLRAAHPLES